MRKLMVGFEMASYAEFDSAVQASSWTLDFPTGRRAGTYCVRNASDGNGGARQANWTLNVPGAPTEFFMRFALQASGGKSERMTLGGSVSGAVLRMEWGGGTTITFKNHAGTTLGTTTAVLGGGWTLLEIHEIIHGSTGILQVKINGVLDLNLTGLNTLSSASGGLGSIFCNVLVGTQANYIDDLVVNDTTGSLNNSWPGDSAIIMVSPTGDVGTPQWTPSTGSSNYAMVDEVSPNNDTDYVQASATAKDYYDLATYTLAAGETFGCVQPVAVWERISLGTPVQAQFGIKAGSTEDLNTAATLPTTYTIARGNMNEKNPDDNAAFDQTDINALQFVLANV